jgi:hypothetical protein
VSRWLLAAGLDPEQTDEFGTTSLITAVEADDLDCVEVLLAAGVTVDRVCNGGTAIGGVQSRAIVSRLLAAGADPAGLSNEGRRLLVGLPAKERGDPLECVSPEEYRRARTRRFGTANPERIHEPFWEAMIRAGVSGYTANKHFCGSASSVAGPVWCAQRFGQTVTLLPDGRAIQIGGEHEDHYDPDFCIYNDVLVHEPAGSIHIFGYPETVFPPTDFHTATLVDDCIYIIGSIGYGRERILETPIFRLNIRTFQIERLSATGESPRWIHRHRATLTPAREIAISGGKVVTVVDGEEAFTDNERTFVLDLARMEWRRANSEGD